ncbi:MULTISPECIES: histidine kinase [unclassified Enterococcus]|uniref:histidine kinase n=1 Tax=unclassified Enterococcus TaxID=2608891 RepID=UPI00247368AD|nr:MULTISPECIES: histidine kinase [unclassified Enterococcus]
MFPTNKQENPLRKLVDKKLYGRYSSVLPISNVSLLLTDIDGEILMEFNPMPDFCKIACQSSYNKVCDHCVKQLQRPEQRHYICDFGLENVYIPIKVDDEILGYVIGIQAFTAETEYKKYLFDLPQISEESGVPIENIAKALAALETIDHKEYRIYEQICEHVANNIALDVQEKVINGNQDVQRLSIEKEILEKKIIDLETKNDSLVINPHFLFNTLNSIARTAYFEKSYTTEELIYCLSDLLRYTLKQENQLHSIESEIDYINKYLYIQKVRFKDRLNYEIDIPDNLRLQHILNMTLQPIVENALVHGITPKREGGKIKIYAVNLDSPDTIEICVEDNGNGFPQKVLDEIENNKDNKMSLGFRSTHRRLKQYFGEKYGLFITKSDFSGSIVTIKIPKNN